jgi:hypothetical protein
MCSCVLGSFVPFPGMVCPLAALPALSNLELATNTFTGDVACLAPLTRMQVMDLSGNQLSGTLTGLDSLLQMKTLTLFANKLTGSVSHLARLTLLQSLDLSENAFTGTAPVGHKCVHAMRQTISPSSCILISAILSIRIQPMHARAMLLWWADRIAGSLWYLCNLTRISKLSVGANSLQGTLDGLQYLPSLRVLNVSHNGLSGTVGAFVTSRWATLSIADFSSNQLVDNLASLAVFEPMVSLQSLILQRNKFTSTQLELQVGCTNHLPQLSNVDLSDNPGITGLLTIRQRPENPVLLDADGTTQFHCPLPVFSGDSKQMVSSLSPCKQVFAVVEGSSVGAVAFVVLVVLLLYYYKVVNFRNYSTCAGVHMHVLQLLFRLDVHVLQLYASTMFFD